MLEIRNVLCVKGRREADCSFLICQPYSNSKKQTLFNFCNFINMYYRFKKVRWRSTDWSINRQVPKQRDKVIYALERLLFKPTVDWLRTTAYMKTKWQNKSDPSQLSTRKKPACLETPTRLPPFPTSQIFKLSPRHWQGLGADSICWWVVGKAEGGQEPTHALLPTLSRGLCWFHNS